MHVMLECKQEKKATRHILIINGGSKILEVALLIHGNLCTCK